MSPLIFYSQPIAKKRTGEKNGWISSMVVEHHVERVVEVRRGGRGRGWESVDRPSFVASYTQKKGT